MAGCAGATAGDSEESSLSSLALCSEKKEAPVVLECFCAEVERKRIELLLF